MCIELILGSPDSLPISQYGPDRNDDTDGHIHVTWGRVKSPDEQALFPNRYLYYIGTRYTGCACGFSGRCSKAENARQDLATFLHRSLEIAAGLQLYVAGPEFGNTGILPLRIDCLGPSDVLWMNGFTTYDFGMDMKVPSFFQII